ncbi:MAG: hypothetical protein V8T86_07635 [Victivallis sp.]
MITLNNIQQFTLNENYPETWDDLDWENPNITDPRYLYSIYQAMVERICKDRVIPTLKFDNMLYYTNIDAHSFKNDSAFNYRYFEILYSWVISTLQIFYNDNAVERAFKFEENKFTATTELMQYNDAEMSDIIGYDYREIPQPFQPFEYYNRFLIGMKNAIQAMKWIYYPLLVAGTSYNLYTSRGGYDEDDEGNVYNFHDGSLTEAFEQCALACNRSWERNKAVSPDAMPSCGVEQQKNYIRRRNDDNELVLKGTYFSYTVRGWVGNDLWLESHFAFPYATTVKTFYIPYGYVNGTYDLFQDNNNYRSYLTGADFGNEIKLWSEEITEPHKRFRSSKKFKIMLENMNLPNSNFDFPSDDGSDRYSSSVNYVNMMYPHWFGLLDISGGCKFK